VKPKSILRGLLAVFVLFTGFLHFVRPAPFVAIVPDYLPAPLALVYISGLFEMLGGIGLLVPRTRRAAAWGLIALFFAVFPANINMAIHNLPFGNEHYPLGGWLRLPLQFVLIAWAYWFTKADE